MKRFLAILLATCGVAQAQVCDLTPSLWNQVVEAAASNDLDPHLLLAVFWVESKWCHEVEGAVTTSPKGALGIGQLMPGTAKQLDVDPLDLNENILGAAVYLREQWETFQDWSLALAAYNAGPQAVTDHKGIPPFEETQSYVTSVLEHLDEFQNLESLALTNEHEQLSLPSPNLAPQVSPDALGQLGNVIYALLPTGDLRNPYQGVYLMPQTVDAQTVYVLLTPPPGLETEVSNDTTATDETFNPGYITFGGGAGREPVISRRTDDGD